MYFLNTFQFLNNIFRGKNPIKIVILYSAYPEKWEYKKKSGTSKATKVISFPTIIVRILKSEKPVSKLRGYFSFARTKSDIVCWVYAMFGIYWDFETVTKNARRIYRNIWNRNWFSPLSNGSLQTWWFYYLLLMYRKLKIHWGYKLVENQSNCIKTYLFLHFT